MGRRFCRSDVDNVWLAKRVEQRGAALGEGVRFVLAAVGDDREVNVHTHECRLVFGGS
jgi:flavin-dependent dehydrogenase